MIFSFIYNVIFCHDINLIVISIAKNVSRDINLIVLYCFNMNNVIVKK